MADNPNNFEAKTQTPGNTATEVETDSKYYLNIGLEANRPDLAFINEVHLLGEPDNPVENERGDFGHAFFYLSEDDRVKNFFSFGPVREDVINEDGEVVRDENGRVVRTETLSTKAGAGAVAKVSREAAPKKGTAHYTITEISFIYRFKISKLQFDVIKQNSEKFSADADAQREVYRVLTNNTCAACAKETLDKSNIDTPSASGPVSMANFAPGFVAGIIQLFNFKNPYMWNKRLKDKYGKGPAIIVYKEELEADKITLVNEWKAIDEQDDPAKDEEVLADLSAD